MRPTLVVNNALNFQGNPLSYTFEVYSDAALSNIVANVPVVASGSDVTSWQVDVGLPNNAQYWWRCCASDGTSTGPWMATASFYVNQINHPPYPVMIPAGQWALADIHGVLTWYPTTDPDEGDVVSRYRVEISSGLTFSNLLINSTIAMSDGAIDPLETFSVPLSDFAGASNLAANATLYHWRVSAMDNWGAWSDWSVGDHTFKLGALQTPRLIGLSKAGGANIMLMWEPTPNNIYVEFRTNLQIGAWSTIAGPLSGTIWTNTFNPETPSGFYRLWSE